MRPRENLVTVSHPPRDFPTAPEQPPTRFLGWKSWCSCWWLSEHLVYLFVLHPHGSLLQLMSPPSHCCSFPSHRTCWALWQAGLCLRCLSHHVSSSCSSLILFLLHELPGHPLCAGHPKRPRQICSSQDREWALFKSAILASHPEGVIAAWVEKEASNENPGSVTHGVFQFPPPNCHQTTSIVKHTQTLH